MKFVSDPKLAIAYSAKIASDPKKLMSLNIKPSDTTKNQLPELYIMLYPFIAGEYVHREDFYNYTNAMKKEFDVLVKAFNAQVKALTTLIQTHIHPSAVPVSPSVTQFSTPEFKTWTTDPLLFTFGEQLITPASNYSTSIDHRNPLMKTTSYSPVKSITTEYLTSLKLVPFDMDFGEEVGSSSYYTGDAEYANIESRKNLI